MTGGWFELAVSRVVTRFHENAMLREPDCRRPIRADGPPAREFTIRQKRPEFSVAALGHSKELSIAAVDRR